jgi:Bacterial Ig-like domain (group 3)
MIRSRFKRFAIVAGAGAVATMTTLAVNPFSAGADGTTTPTTTSVTGPSSLVAGHAAKFTATISPFETGSAPVTKATGTVAFTIVGSDSSTVACAGGNPLLSSKGKAVCKVAADTLFASAAPYSVTAVYSGDDNFGTSTGNLSQTVAQVGSRLKLTYLAAPTSGSSSTFTATVTGGAGSDPTGFVQFAASSTPAPSPTSLLRCSGGNHQALSASSSTPPVMTATCVLAAKWFKVPASSKTDPKPVATWTVTATYAGDGNYKASGASKSGSAKG